MFTQAIADQILAGLSDGRSLRAVCRADGMPDAATVLRWTKDKEYVAFAQQYTDARARSYELLADEIIELSDGGTDDVARDRLSVDSRKWMLSKMLPKVYGEKIETTLQVGDSITKIVREIV